jgi:hypothetical protein
MWSGRSSRRQRAISQLACRNMVTCEHEYVRPYFLCIFTNSRNSFRAVLDYFLCLAFALFFHFSFSLLSCFLSLLSSFILLFFHHPSFRFFYILSLPYFNLERWIKVWHSWLISGRCQGQIWAGKLTILARDFVAFFCLTYSTDKCWDSTLTSN